MLNGNKYYEIFRKSITYTIFPILKNIIKYKLPLKHDPAGKNLFPNLASILKFVPYTYTYIVH